MSKIYNNIYGEIMICIIMGSESDLKIAEKGVNILKEFGVDFEVRVASAHRTPELVEDIIKNSDAKVFSAPSSAAFTTSNPVFNPPSA